MFLSPYHSLSHLFHLSDELFGPLSETIFLFSKYLFSLFSLSLISAQLPKITNKSIIFLRLSVINYHYAISDFSALLIILISSLGGLKCRETRNFWHFLNADRAEISYQCYQWFSDEPFLSGIVIFFNYLKIFNSLFHIFF